MENASIVPVWHRDWWRRPTYSLTLPQEEDDDPTGNKYWTWGNNRCRAEGANPLAAPRACTRNSPRCYRLLHLYAVIYRLEWTGEPQGALWHRMEAEPWKKKRRRQRGKWESSMTFHTVCEREKRALFTFHRAEPRENKGGRWRRRVPFQLFCTRVLSLLEKKKRTNLTTNPLATTGRHIKRFWSAEKNVTRRFRRANLQWRGCNCYSRVGPDVGLCRWLNRFSSTPVLFCVCVRLFHRVMSYAITVRPFASLAN